MIFRISLKSGQHLALPSPKASWVRVQVRVRAAVKLKLESCSSVAAFALMRPELDLHSLQQYIYTHTLSVFDDTLEITL